jgi:hypothetical protein
MKQFWLVAAALLLTTLLPDGASAQRGGFRGGAIGGGFRAAAIGGGFRGGVSPGFRAAAIGGGFRGVGPGIARVGPGFRGVGPGISRVGPGFRAAAIGPRFRTAAIAPGVRAAAIGRGFRVAGFRRRGFVPFVAGAGLGFAATYPYYYSGYYSDPCVVWDGYEWVNVCPYYPYYY